MADRETLDLLDTVVKASDEREDSAAATSDAEAELRASSKADKVDRWEDKEALHEPKMNLEEEEERRRRTEDSNLMQDGNLGMSGKILGRSRSWSVQRQWDIRYRSVATRTTI